MFNYTTKDNAQVAEMLKEAVRMFRESQRDGFRMGRRADFVAELTAECKRRGINVAEVALAA